MNMQLGGCLQALIWLAAMSVLSACSSSHGAPLEAHKDASTRTENEQSFEHFIRRNGSKLYDGDREFRFISVNVPTLNYVEDEMRFDATNPYGLPNEFELRDLYGAVNQIGGQVVRSYTIPVRNTNFAAEAITYVEAPGVFNEEAFEAMDLAIALASEYQVRLIIPLVNNWQWMGGRPNYAAFRGKDDGAFCDDRQIIDDFKQTIAFVTNRVNTITGIAYNEDPAIMAWETGNEMTCPPEWATEIASYIKSQAPKQLVIDGWHAVHMPNLNDFVQPHSINHPDIDLVSTHHYEDDPIKMLENLQKTVELIDGKKPLFVGEFSFVSTSGIEQVMDYIIEEEAIAGGLIWSLRRRHRDGGWYYHSEPLGSGMYRAYHWPGFDDGISYDERGFLKVLRDKAFEIAKKIPPQITVPSPPNLLPIKTVGAISWQGSVGAEDYTVERADQIDGPWTAIVSGRDDMEAPGFPLVTDETARLGEAYYYRVLARNAAGFSSPSNIVGPIIPMHLTRVDRARNYGTVTLWNDVEIKSDNWRSYKEATWRLSGRNGSELIYSAPGFAQAIRVFAFEAGPTPLLEVSTSLDGEIWNIIQPTVDDYTNAEENYDYLTPRQYSWSAEDTNLQKYVRLQFQGGSDIVRVELDYVPN